MKRKRRKKSSKFKALVRKLKRKGVKSPKALAAWIGRKKFGKRFQKMAKAGRRKARRNCGRCKYNSQERVKNDIPASIRKIQRVALSLRSKAHRSGGKSTHIRAAKAFGRMKAAMIAQGISDRFAIVDGLIQGHKRMASYSSKKRRMQGPIYRTRN